MKGDVEDRYTSYVTSWRLYEAGVPAIKWCGSRWWWYRVPEDPESAEPKGSPSLGYPGGMMCGQGRPAYALHDLTAVLPEGFAYELAHIDQGPQANEGPYRARIFGPAPWHPRMVGIGRADSPVEALALAILKAIESGTLIPAKEA